VEGAEASFDASAEVSYQRTPSTFDRSVEPPYAAKPLLNVPAINVSTLANGLRVYGIQDTELPLVQFELAIESGLLLENPQTPGVANFVAELLDKGTALRTTAELEEALALLGAEIDVTANDEYFLLSGRTLARSFDATMALVAEMLLQPRWDQAEIELARARIVADLQDLLSSPTGIADQAYALVTYGADHVFARDLRGTPASVAAMTVADLLAYHQQLSPALSSFRVVGAVEQTRINAALDALVTGWTVAAPQLPDVAAAQAPVTSKIFFYDMPGAAQSVFRFGHPGPLRTSPDYYPAQVLNYRLGGGGFASRLTQQLREGKGYTYGINSRFAGTARQGGFLLASSVRSNVTQEAMQLASAIMEDFGQTFTQDDLDVSKSFLLKSQARAFESSAAKLRMLGEVADYGLPHDYVLQQGAVAEAMTVAEIRALAVRYLHPEAMNYVIVGDATTQVPLLRAAGLPEPVLINDLLR
jgi:zinc protease